MAQQSTQTDLIATEMANHVKPADASCVGMFDVAETIQRLCNEGMLDLGVPVTESKTTESVERIISRRENLDLLSESYLDSLVDQIFRTTSRRVGVILSSKSGKIIGSAHAGWDPSLIRTQKKILEKIARESSWQPATRLSSDALQACAPIARNPSSEDGGNTAKYDHRGSIFLNSLAAKVHTPLVLVSIALPKCSGTAIFYVDATSCAGKTLESCLQESNRLWSEQHDFEFLIQQLDTWMIVQRCGWMMKMVSKLDWIRNKPRWWLPPIAIACCAMAAPVPYYPKRECVFEPETKQFLASPVAGRIASCEVRPGDAVETGQLLARMDDDLLKRDLATAQADYDSAHKKRDAALAARASGTAALADIEMKQAVWRIESIEDHLRRLEIRAAAPGIVVQGDWHRSVGMPVTLGQNLFEVAELESMTAEVRLKASDLGQINVGDEVHVRSDASGLNTFHGKIIRIEPRATVIDNSAVFIADVIIRDKSLQLRPGMKASAQITAGWRSLGWLLFERPYRWIANQWIW